MSVVCPLQDLSAFIDGPDDRYATCKRDRLDQILELERQGAWLVMEDLLECLRGLSFEMFAVKLSSGRMQSVLPTPLLRCAMAKVGYW